jgi:hypothetical protein
MESFKGELPAAVLNYFSVAYRDCLLIAVSKGEENFSFSSREKDKIKFLQTPQKICAIMQFY